MSRFRNKITDVLKLQPHKPCGSLTNEELIEEEAHCRKELVRLVLSLSIHVGTCTTHGVLSAGTTLPIHVPVVVWVAYSLTKVARRHRALKIEIRDNRPKIELKKLKTRRFAVPVVLGLISPVLSALGADILNEIVLTLVGSDTICSIGLPSVSKPVDISGDSCAPGDGFEFVTATGDDSPDHQFSVTEQVSQEAIQALLERWAEHIEGGAPEDFARLVQDLNSEVHCNACGLQISNGFSCSECHDFDLCRGCYYGMKHPDVKQHEYEEFKIEEEITQIQRIMGSLRRENVTVACSRGGFVQCNKCQNTLSTPTSNFKADPVYYYTCKGCDDFDVCLKCFPEEELSPVHKGHVFGMTVATDDEATISRLSPTTSKLGTPQSPGTPRLPGTPGTPSTWNFRRSPLPSPETKTHTRLPSLFQSPPVPPPVPRKKSRASSSPTTPRKTSARELPVQPLYWCDCCVTLIESSQRWQCLE
ncbi:hypothetical protein FRC07_008468 [Ceratobasidium sp. 392]|nr:hypothetical protein FRC07_008468 [Ceratobasidium sp. 392]